MSGSRRFLAARDIIGGSSGVSGVMTGDITSLTIPCEMIDLIGIFITWAENDIEYPTGTLTVNAAGTLKVIPNVVSKQIWLPLPGYTVSGPNGSSAGSTFVDLIETSAPNIQLVYTFESGNGLLYAQAFGKGW